MLVDKMSRRKGEEQAQLNPTKVEKEKGFLVQPERRQKGEVPGEVTKYGMGSSNSYANMLVCWGI